jgi:hypothetical protein
MGLAMSIGANCPDGHAFYDQNCLACVEVERDSLKADLARVRAEFEAEQENHCELERQLDERNAELSRQLSAANAVAKELREQLDMARGSIKDLVMHAPPSTDAGPRPPCAVCGKPSTNGIGQQDPADPMVATLEFRCDEHRPEPPAAAKCDVGRCAYEMGHRGPHSPGWWIPNTCKTCGRAEPCDCASPSAAPIADGTGPTWTQEEIDKVNAKAREYDELFAPDVRPPTTCRCAAIQAADPSRHFKGCPERVENTEAKRCAQCGKAYTRPARHNLCSDECVLAFETAPDVKAPTEANGFYDAVDRAIDEWWVKYGSKADGQHEAAAALEAMVRACATRRIPLACRLAEGRSISAEEELALVNALSDVADEAARASDADGKLRIALSGLDNLLAMLTAKHLP